VKSVSILIGERDAMAAHGRTFDRLDPMTGEIASRAAAASVADARTAADAAAAAFPGWSALGPSARRAVLLRAADLMEKSGEEFAETMLVETGGTAPWAHFNTQLTGGMLREAAAMTTQITGEVIAADKPNSFAMAVREPAGVCLGIAPWNAPSFGPVTTVVRVKDVERAVRTANDTEYGLSAAVFGRDITRALAVAKQIQSGICHINAPTVHDEAQMPFGGVKASGYGRFGGKAAIAAFTELQLDDHSNRPPPLSILIGLLRDLRTQAKGRIGSPMTMSGTGPIDRWLETSSSSGRL
jgi:acyl-CoA reductase-like NAD-dependent aldehyde dehydrogenase